MAAKITLEAISDVQCTRRATKQKENGKPSLMTSHFYVYSSSMLTRGNSLDRQTVCSARGRTWDDVNSSNKRKDNHDLAHILLRTHHDIAPPILLQPSR
jgi:hypothetical protein